MSTLPSSFPLSLDTLSTLRPVDLAGLIGYPIIGNLLNWPSDYQAETMQLSILGKDVLFLTSACTI
ncbi:hypothetical protein FB451DRAFT_1408598 [Mycena latifolia]|nr:hypothetical protein FB451DRAFT_1408598 [Mycena latifolia]